MCPHENMLVRLIGDELSPSEREHCLTHLQACEGCRAKFAELQATWDLLGQWEVTPPAHDLTGRVLAAASSSSGRPRWVAMAASLLLAAGAGVAAGLLVPASTPPSVAQRDITTEQMLQATGLDAIAGETVVFTPLFSANAPASDDSQEPQS